MIWQGKDVSNKLMVFMSERKKNSGIPLFNVKRLCLKIVRGCDTGEEGGGSRHSFGNNKNK